MKTYRSIQAIYLKAKKLGLQANNNRRAVYCWETQKSYISAAEAARQTGIGRSQISLCCNGEPFNTAGGYHWCFLENKNNFIPQNNPQWRKVYCLELNKNFASIKQAEHDLNIDHTSINHACSNHTQLAGGYHWCYEEDKELLINNLRHGREKIICIETQKIYDSVEIATNQLHIFNINLCCQGKQHLAGGYHWAYLSDIERQNELKQYINQQSQPKLRPVICIETQKTFPTINAAAEEYSLQPANIYKCCTQQRLTTGGYHWCYLEDYNLQLKYQKYIHKEPKRTIKPVICIELKQYFPSAVIAGQSTNSCKSQIGAVCRGQRKTTNKMHWRFATEEEIQQQKYIRQSGDPN